MVTNHIVSLLQLFVRVLYLLLAPTLGALLLGALIFLSGATEDFQAIHWIILSPILYFAWLIFFLSCSAIEIQAFACLYKKPARMVYEYSDTSFAPIDLLLLSAYYQNFFRTWSLPLCTSLIRIPYLRELVLLSYAPSISIGRDVILFGYIYDPDLVQIGDGAVLGAWCEINAHSFDSQPDGSFVYARFPVTIGARAVIGAKARIDMGATIGADAVVEPSSYVPALTNIPDGEVWGGNPAVFRRTRIQMPQPKIGSAQSKLTSDNDNTRSHQKVDEVARSLVAEALDLPLERVTEDISIHTCDVWDSLGQMQIASALHDRFGIQIPAEKIFQIQDLETVKHFINTNSRQQPINDLPIDLPENPEWLPLLNYQKATQALATYYQGKRGFQFPGRSRSCCGGGHVYGSTHRDFNATMEPCFWHTG